MGSAHIAAPSCLPFLDLSSAAEQCLSLGLYHCSTLNAFLQLQELAKKCDCLSQNLLLFAQLM